MCGIAGFLRTKDTKCVADFGGQDRLAAMLHGIQHRGPDDWGMTFLGLNPEGLRANNGHVKWLASPDVSLALGHQRLSILDLSRDGRQPMLSRDGAYCITFNGEIYNYIELREDLVRQVEFRTRTDTEVLLEAYRQWGIGMLTRLDGMFAFALWDGPAKKLVCARDAMGIKPFYYASLNGTFFFGSEPKAVLAGLGSKGHVDSARLAEFLVLGVSDHDDGTSYREVRQLPGGHFIEVNSDGSVSKPCAFWKPSKRLVNGERNIPELVREQIERAVRRQLRSDVPVGSCLSGGLDSGSIAATVGQVLGSVASQFKALTLVNQGFDGDESALAGITAQHAGIAWQRVEPQKRELAAELEDMVRAMDEPFPTLSMFAQRKIMHEAHSMGLKVMLDGQGGDEVFLGYPRVAMRAIGEHFANGNIGRGLQEWRLLSRNGSQSRANIFLSNIFFRSPAFVLWRNKKRLEGLVEKDFLEQVRPEVAHEMYDSHQNVFDIQVGELTRFCLPQLLRFEDRNSMAYGVEARVPLLSVDLVELGIGLPLEWKVKDGWTKYALRAAMDKRMAREIVWNRLKLGFEVPQRQWVEAARHRIAAWLADVPQECPVKAPGVLAAIDAGLGGEQWLWRCLSVALWFHFFRVSS